MRSEEEVNRAINSYSDMVRRLCYVHLKNYADTEDIFQTVFLKYAQSNTDFADQEHEKAWLIRVTINACKDLLRNFFRRNTVDFDEFYDFTAEVQDEHREVLEAVLQLPEKYRDVIYLFYYEGYSAIEISKILNRKVNTIYTWLDRARKDLYEILKDNWEGMNHE